MSILPVGPCPAKVMIVGEFPTTAEELAKSPLAGTAGRELDKMLNEVGIIRSACFVTQVVREVSQRNNVYEFIAEKKKDITKDHVKVRNLFCLPPVLAGIELLKREIELCQPNVIIACGNLALWALTGNWGITKWRGSQIKTDLQLALDYQPKVIPIIAPDMIMRQWSWRQITMVDLRRAKREAERRELILPNYSFLIRPNYGEVLAILHQLQTAADKGPIRLSVDIETRNKHITCIGLAWSKLEAICIPFFTAQQPEGYWSLEEEAEIVLRLTKLLANRNVQPVKLIGQNFHYDAQYIYRWWHCEVSQPFDTMTGHHSCFSNLPKGLDFLSSMYCEYHAYWKDEGKEWDISKPPEENWTYNCKDCVITFEIAEVLARNIEGMGLQTIADFQQGLFHPVLKTMNQGLRVNTALRGQFAIELQDEIAKREQFFIDLLGHPLNPKSPQQMQRLFFDDFKQRKTYKRGTNNVTLDDEALRTIAQREPLLQPLCRKISEYRSLGVFLSTFVNAPLGDDGRIRCSFKTTGTETFRFASSKDAFGSGLNLQNVPKGGDEGDGLELPNIRKYFIPDPGHTFFDIDLDSADLRIVCWEANIPEMKAMLAEGKKIYVEVAREYYKDPTITKKHPSYGTFKSLCHGTHYMGTAKGLAERLGLLVHEIEKIQKWYFGKFPELKKWHQDLTDQVFKRRMVQNVFGYKIHFFDRLEGTIMNQAVAWIPQSTVACIINRGYVNIHKNLAGKVDVLLQVHDSLAGQYPTSIHEWAIKRIQEECAIPLPYEDPLTVGVGVKTSTVSWGDCD